MSININYAAWENSLKLTWSKKETVVCEASFYFKNLKFTLLKYFSLSLFRLWCKDYRNNFARASRFLYISLPSLDDYGVNCQILRFIDNGNIRRQISLSLSKLEFTPGKCAYIGQSELVGIIALKFQRTRSQFFREVFAAEPVVVS